MAQHFKIEEWENQEWYPKIMKEIERGVDLFSRFEDVTVTKFRCKVNLLGLNKIGGISSWLILPTDEYKMRDDTAKVLGYTPSERFDMQLEPDKDENQGYLPNMKINQCNFEVHVDKDNKVQQVYLPL